MTPGLTIISKHTDDLDAHVNPSKNFAVITLCMIVENICICAYICSYFCCVLALAFYRARLMICMNYLSFRKKRMSWSMFLAVFLVVFSSYRFVLWTIVILPIKTGGHSKTLCPDDVVAVTTTKSIDHNSVFSKKKQLWPVNLSKNLSFSFRKSSNNFIQIFIQLF